MSDIPKIQVNERELWLLTYYGKLLPKWECKMWATLSNVLSDNEQLVEIYLIKKRKGCGVSVYVHEYIGYGCVNVNNYLQLSADKILE